MNKDHKLRVQELKRDSSRTNMKKKLVEKLFETLAKNTKKDPDNWIWFNGELFHKVDAEKLLKKIKKNKK